MTAVAAVLLSLCLQDSAEEKAFKKVAGDLPNLIKAAGGDEKGPVKKDQFHALAPAIRTACAAALNEADPSIAEKKAAKDLKKYDKDGDGKLSDDEKKAMDEAVRLKAIKDFDWDGDGKLSDHEKTAMQWAEEGKCDGLLRAIDKDSSGDLSIEEITAGLAAITGIKIKKPKQS